jgi:hypothetical protein
VCRPTSKYLEIASQLAVEIQKMGPGTRCPGIAEITAKWGVARATAEKVLRHLAEQGYVTRVVGSGTFVADSRPTRIAILPYFLFSSGQVQRHYACDHCLHIAEMLAGRLREMGHEPVMVGKVARDVPDLAALDRLQPKMCVVLGGRGAEFVRPLIDRKLTVVVVRAVPSDLPVDIVQRELIRPGRTAVRAFLDCGLTDIHLVWRLPDPDRGYSNLHSRTCG